MILNDSFAFWITFCIKSSRQKKNKFIIFKRLNNVHFLNNYTLFSNPVKVKMSFF